MSQSSNTYKHAYFSVVFFLTFLFFKNFQLPTCKKSDVFRYHAEIDKIELCVYKNQLDLCHAC